MSRAPHIAVFGGSQIGPGHPTWAEAEALGRGLAAAGCVLITGGYGGVMEAAARGAVAAGGHTIGLTVGLMGAREANSAIAERIHSEDLFTRLEKFVTQADAFIAVHGGIGTLLEIALLWNLKVLGALQQPPVWLVGTGWAALLDLCRRELAVREQDFAHLTLAPDVQTVVTAVRALSLVVVTRCHRETWSHDLAVAHAILPPPGARGRAPLPCRCSIRTSSVTSRAWKSWRGGSNGGR